MKNITIVLSIILAGLIGCASPLQGPKSDDSNGSTSATKGTLSINLPSVASWLKPFTSGSNSPSSRALLRATSVSVTVQDNYGTTVVPTTTQTLSLEAGGSAPTALTPITGVKTGANYTVYVSIFNSAVSSDYPIVTGSVSGVSITKNATTEVTVTCLPTSYYSVVTNVTKQSTVYANAEVWYSFTVAATVSHTLTQTNPNTPTFLFDADGNYLKTITSTTPYVWSPTKGVKYFIGVANVGSSTETSQVLMTADLPLVNEGSVASPVIVALNTSRDFTLGPNGAADESSYYRFTTSTAGDYYGTFPSAYQNYTLYSDSGFTQSVAYDYSVSGFWMPGLSASTNYYLKLTNLYSVASTWTGAIYTPAQTATLTKAEGTPSSPVSLSLGSAHAGRVGDYEYSRISYYKFTTGAGAAYRLTLNSVAGTESKVAWYLGTSVNSSSFTGDSDSSPLVVLTPNTTYYLRLIPYGGWNPDSTHQTTFNITASATTIPAGTTLALDTMVEATATDPTVPVYFTATVDPGTYQVVWYDSYDGPGDYAATADVIVSAYNADGTVIYFSGEDSGYSSPQTITVTGSGPQTVRLAVRCWDGSPGVFKIGVVTPSYGGLVVNVQ